MARLGDRPAELLATTLDNDTTIRDRVTLTKLAFILLCGAKVCVCVCRRAGDRA